MLEGHLIPYIAGRVLIFQQDNASAHGSVVAMKCPPKGPDNNPIENLWDVVEAKVREDMSTTRKSSGEKFSRHITVLITT